MPTSIANLWTPDIWIKGINEKMQTLPALISSPIVRRSPQLDQIASGAGITATIPYFKDITDQADAVQVENTQPTRQTITGSKQVATILNRETANDATALASQVSGEDVVGAITAQIAMRRQKQRQTTLIAILRGLFGFSSAPAGGGCMAAVRNDIFLEAGAAPPAGQCIDSSKFIDTAALLGELVDSIQGGGILMHTLIRAALMKQDQISFEHYSTQEGIKIETYKGMRVFVSNALRRAGSTSGYVYDTYLFTPGVVGWGEKPQQGDTVDVASLSYYMDKQKNNEEIYDRSRFLMHVAGTKWTGTPAAQSATNAELGTLGNWSLDYASADRVGVACLRSNG